MTRKATQRSRGMTRLAAAVAVRSDGLYGAATDALAIRKTLDESLGRSYFHRIGVYVLCFGLGGSARALALTLLSELSSGGPPFSVRAGGPRKVHAVGRRPESLVTLHLTSSPPDNAKLLGELPDASVIVNATGLGKDAPGSPLSRRAILPRRGIVWDFNHRGEPDFLVTAASQAATRDARVFDGWLLFLHGWAEALSPLVAAPVDDATFGRLAHAAAAIGPPAGWMHGPRKEAGLPADG